MDKAILNTHESGLPSRINIDPMGSMSILWDERLARASRQVDDDFQSLRSSMNKPSPEELDKLFAQARTPAAGRALIREILDKAPVRELQRRTDTVRTCYLSKKMDAAFLAESRTVELAAFVWYEHDKSVTTYLPQPCKLDLHVSGVRSGRTRVSHTPDVFVISDGHFYLDEWRTEERLERLASESPHRFRKDEDGTWHYLPAEELCAQLGITHRLRSASELPRVFIDNMRFLGDYNLETAPPVPESVVGELRTLLAERQRIPHLELVHQLGFKADHIFALVLDGRVYVDLFNTRCSEVDTLNIYASETVGKADAVLRGSRAASQPECVVDIRAGARFVFDGRVHEVVLPGMTEVVVRDEEGNAARMSLKLIADLCKEQQIAGTGTAKTQREYDLEAVVANEDGLRAALERLDAVRCPETSQRSVRSLRRYRAAVRGVSDATRQLVALRPAKGGNNTPRLPERVVELAEESMKQHNRPACPTVQATYSHYVQLCADAHQVPMSRANFYRWIKARVDVKKREGKRKHYQKKHIPLTHDYDHPLHGVQPHEVVYCDHTIVNMFCKGQRVENLGKPTLTVMTDGALSRTRAFVLLFSPASIVSVLMVLRDYVRRWHCLPRILVLDNGREFHSDAVEQVCSLFGIEIRWRRRSKPRDSTLVERALGATETEIFANLDGNTRALKNPREVSSEVNPERFVTWTLTALHGSLEHYFFEVHAKRVHPRFGVSPDEREKQMLLEFGAREHRFVTFSPLFKLLTSPWSGRETRKVDPLRGVFVDGILYWNDRLRNCAPKSFVQVRVEHWNASVIYVLIDGDWVVAHARDGSRVEGRFAREVEMAIREERRRKKSLADADRSSAEHASEIVKCFDPTLWDEALRERCVEEHRLYARLGMVEALPVAANRHSAELQLGLYRSSDLPLIYADQAAAPAAAAEGPEPELATVSAADGPAPSAESDVELDYF